MSRNTANFNHNGERYACNVTYQGMIRVEEYHGSCRLVGEFNPITGWGMGPDYGPATIAGYALAALGLDGLAAGAEMEFRFSSLPRTETRIRFNGKPIARKYEGHFMRGTYTECTERYHAKRPEDLFTGEIWKIGGRPVYA